MILREEGSDLFRKAPAEIFSSTKAV